jgi:hypothetical protein
LFVRWPAGNLGKPRDVAVPAEIQDLLPTFVELFDLKKPAAARFDGVSLAGLLKDTADALPDRMLVVQYGQILKKWDSAVIWNRWRLVKGEELYDLKADPEQSRNVAAEHSDVLARMRAHYSGWWSEIEPGLKNYVPITIGSDRENPVRLTSSDWQDVYCDNPNCVGDGGPEGAPRGAPWNVWVEKDGEYEIALRRWPVEQDLALSAPLAARKLTVAEMPAGKAMPIAEGRLTVANNEAARKVEPGDKAVVFRVRLKGGTKTQLHGWFQDASGKDLCGAYYAYVKRI